MKFSIITCTWNSEPYLAQCIESVLEQDYEDIEYIFVDGGSTDGTLERIQRISREVLVVKGVRGGIGRAMNEGVRVATGDVIAHLHSDDYYLYPSVLSDVAEVMGATECEWVYGRHMTDIDGELYPESYTLPEFSYRELLRLNFIPHPATFVRKRVFDKVGGFDEALKYSMDYDFFLRISKLYQPEHIDKHLTAFRVHGGSTSSANAAADFHQNFRVRMRHAGLSPWALLYHGAHYVVRGLRLARRLSAERS